MDPTANWREYVAWDSIEVLERLSEVSQALAQLHVEYGMVRGQEKHAKVNGFRDSIGETVTARTHYADANAITITETVFSLESQIKELQEEQGLLNTILTWKLSGAVA